MFWASVIKFWCFFRRIKNSKGFNQKSIPKIARKKTKNWGKTPKIYLAGRTSDSAEISDQYEDLLKICGGSPCVEVLPFGASTSNVNASIQAGTSNSTSSDNNTTGVSSGSEDNSSIFNASSVRLPQRHGQIINSTDDADDYSVSNDSNNNKNVTKNLQKKKKN